MKPDTDSAAFDLLRQIINVETEPRTEIHDVAFGIR